MRATCLIVGIRLLGSGFTLRPRWQGKRASLCPFFKGRGRRKDRSIFYERRRSAGRGKERSIFYERRRLSQGFLRKNKHSRACLLQDKQPFYENHDSSISPSPTVLITIKEGDDELGLRIDQANKGKNLLKMEQKIKVAREKRSRQRSREGGREREGGRAGEREGCLSSIRSCAREREREGYPRRTFFFKGILDDDTAITVKRIDGEEHDGEEFKAEVAALATVQHRNLVRLLGFRLVPRGPWFLVGFQVFRRRRCGESFVLPPP